MTQEEAEEVWMAWQLGFEDDHEKIAMAVLVLKADLDEFIRAGEK